MHQARQLGIFVGQYGLTWYHAGAHLNQLHMAWL